MQGERILFLESRLGRGLSDNQFLKKNRDFRYILDNFLNSLERITQFPSRLITTLTRALAPQFPNYPTAIT